MNITQESDSFKEGSTNIKRMTRFEKIVNRTSAQDRIEMVRLGYNPFKEEHIEEFRAIKTYDPKASFWKRLKIGLSFIFTGKVSDDLQIIAMRSYSPSMTDDGIFKGSVIDPLKKEYIDKLVASPEGSTFVRKDTEYMEDLKKQVAQRVKEIEQDNLIKSMDKPLESLKTPEKITKTPTKTKNQKKGSKQP